MAKKEKEVKTNAMRILEKLKIPFEVKTYECDEFVDGMHIAGQLGQPYEQSFKTLVMQGKSKEYYVFVLPVDKEVDLKKAAHVVGEKSLAMVHVKDIQAVTGYIRGGCTSIGMKKKYRTVIHESAKEWDTVIVSGGRLGSQILLSPDDLVKAVDGEMADIVFCENK
ncbi:MAG: Cys-tRNA(Pro) deacylase [Clostridium sp.]